MKQFLGFEEVRTAKFIKAVFCEFLATGILLICGYGSCITMNAGQPFSILMSAFTAGMAVGYIVWTFNHLSGAHINPVVTIGFFVTGHISMVKSIAYIIAQCAGGIAGSASIWYMVPEKWRTTFGSLVFADGLTIGQGFAVEAVSSFLMMLGVFATSDQYRNDHAGSMPLTVGLLIFSQIAWAGMLTGCSMNPVRSFGPAVINGTWDNHWVYWVAPVIGGAAGSLLYEYVLAESPQGSDMSIDIEPSRRKSLANLKIEAARNARKLSLVDEKIADMTIIVETNRL